MDSVILYVNDQPCPHWVVPIPGDGSCLFHSLSFSMYGNIESSYDIRLAIIEYVVAHWDELQVYTCDEHGDTYINANLYSTAMVKTSTYGSASELMAAAALYPYAFEVYDNGLLRASFGGDSGKPVKRLRFSGSYLGGHYEALLPDVPPNDNNLNNKNNNDAILPEVPSKDDNSIKNNKNLTKKGGRPKKVSKGRPKTSTLSRSQQIKEAATRYRHNNPEKRKETLAGYTTSHREVNRQAVSRYTASHPEVHREAVSRYTASHPEVHREAVSRYTASHPEVRREAVSRYTASHPEVNQKAVARYKDLHPELNLHSVQRKRSNQKLQLRLKNLGTITQALTNKIKNRLEAEKLIKWAIHNRQQTLASFNKTIDSLKNKFKVSLEKLSSCHPDSSLNDKLECFLGKSEHRSNQEPYYAGNTYNLLKNKDKSIEIDNTGKAVFGNVKKHGHSLVWSCNDLCALDENVIIQLTNIFESLVNKTSAQYYTLIEKEQILDYLNYINTLKAHFPRLRTISREIYQVQSIFNILKDIDESLEKSDVERIKKHGKQQKVGSIVVESEESHEIVEDEVINKYKAAFKSLKLKCLDTPKLECMSCIKLCYSRDTSSLNRLRKAIDTSIWKDLLNYYKTNNLDHSPFICHSCLQKIRANQLPAPCVLNDLHVSTVPPQIVELNDYEKILIQRAKSFQVVMLMNPVASKHLPNRHMVKKVKGRTFHLPLPLEETLKKLPRPEYPITNPEMYIMVRGMPTKSKIVWEDIVDVNKVYQALQYLKGVNALYSQIQLPHSPQHLIDYINEEDNIHHLVDQLESQVDNVVEANDGLLTQVTSEKEADYEQYTIYPLHERRRNAPISELYQMLKVNAAPIDSRDKDLDVKCFPDLYIEGKYGQFHVRQQKLTSSEYIKARLMSKHSQFRLNKQYLFFLLNDANIRQISSGIFYKMNCVNQKQKITAEQYFNMLNKDELEGDLTAIFGRLRNTEQFWKKPRNDVNCMTKHYGPATWFLTMSPSEWMWDDLGEYLKEVNGPEMANKSISELVALDPVSTSRFIDNKFKAMLDFIMSSDEPLGKVIHYFWRREYQSRGAQHFHLMLWVKDAPILHESSLDEVASFISKYITCAIPDKNVSPTLYQRVTSYQTHKHNNYCMRQKKTRRGFVKVCRFGFPRPVTEVLTIRDIIESIAARKTLSPNNRLYYIVRKKEWVMVNDYNPAILLAWNGNTDIQYVGEKTAILNYYITKYTTKSEKTHVADMFQDINSTKPLRSRLFNIGLRVLSSRECGSLEASDTLLGIPLYGTDPTTTIRWLDVNIFRNRRVKSKSDMMMLEPESTDIYYESWIDDHYPKRPKELETINLYSFAQYYDIVKTRPVSSKVECYEINEGKKFLKKRAYPYLINHYFYDGEQVPEKYYFSLLILFKPWRCLDELKLGCDTYTEAFNLAKEDLKEGVDYGNSMIESRYKIQKAFEMIESKVAEINEERKIVDDDEGPENPLDFEAVEAANAMDEFQRINLVEEEQTDLQSMIAKLNADQKRVFDMITKKMDTSDTNADVLRCFVSGTGGTGKSFLIKTLKVWVKMYLNKKVAVSAPTGIAAFNVNGLTIHRLLQLPVEHKQTPKYKPLSDEVLKVLRSDLKEVVLFIIDEVSMISNVTLTYIHLRLSEIFDTNDDQNGWFGKKHLVVFGDLLQLPPVREKSPFEKLTTAETNKLLGSLSIPNLWIELFIYDELTINMRQLNDSDFVDMLNRIRLGVTTQKDRDLLSTRLITLKSDSNENRLVEIIEHLSKLPNDTVCLLPTKNMCQQLNTAMLRSLPHPEIKLTAVDSLDCPKYLTKRARESIKKYEDDASMTAGLEENIIIKIGAKVMLRRNIDVSLGLVNGSIGIVQRVKVDPDNTKIIKKIYITFNNEHVYELCPVKTKFEIINRAYVHRKQFPICIAYAITIHKSQGLSLHNALMDIGSTVFTSGQAYVALSRVTSLGGLHLMNVDFGSIKAQESSICEYNRLRSIYRPDLSKIVTSKPPRKTHRDREWALRKTVAEAQEVVPEKRKRKATYKNKKSS